jgi:hypothetical protein
MVDEIRQLRLRRGVYAAMGRLEVFLASAGEIPRILEEIGRLREETFRQVGEGTGNAVDLDRFDAGYLHLFLWDHATAEVAGAYRLGCTDVLLASGGAGALYTTTLFEFESTFLNSLNPALELGRSFVTLKYQRSIHALALLWRGIGRFITERPQYARLFGPVSISGQYSAVSQELMVRFLRNHRQDESSRGWIKPMHPYQPIDIGSISARLRSIEEVSAAVSQTEADGKGIPVLLKQYLRLNATLLEFSCDPDFSNALDALVMVDLREAPAEILRRYLGNNGYNALVSNDMRCLAC